MPASGLLRHRLFTAWRPGTTDQPPPAPPWRIRTSLALLVLACLTPGALISSYFIVADYQQNKARAIREVIATARAVAANLDRDLASIESGLRVLATSSALTQDDLATFYQQASSAQPYQHITNYVLMTPSGQQLINTLRPWGAPLPMVGGPRQLQQIFETGAPLLSDVFIGPVSGKPILALGVPVMREGKVVYALHAGIFPDRVAELIKAQELQPGWISAVLDSQGNVAARNLDMARYVGKPAVPALVKLAREQREGVLETNTLEGIPVITAFSRSSISDWSVAVGIPQAGLTHNLKQSLTQMLIANVIVFAGALWLAWRWALSRVVVPADRLLRRMDHIAKGEDPGPIDQTGASAEFVALEQGFHDMGERLKQRECERESTLLRLTQTFESITDGFYLLDENWRFAYVNQRARALMQLHDDDLIGKDHWTALPAQDAPLLRAFFERALLRQEAVHTEIHLPVLDLFLAFHAYPSEHGLAVYFQDLREVQAAREAREAQRLAEASNHAKTEFLSRMSHELRTPLNAVLGFAQVLMMNQREPLSPHQRVMLGHIESSGRHLLEMISEVLDVSRIEAGTMQVLIDDVDITALMRDCELMITNSAQEASLQLSMQGPEGPLWVRADRIRLKQVLLNLMSNAIKYNRPGGQITVRAQARGETVRLSVSDTGVGLSATQLEHLFEPFNRLGREHSSTPGTGIGLVICKRLLDLMGSQLHVHSVEQQGSTFYFDLPLQSLP